MIAKKYRLTENEVKKVLACRKPFFAHNIIANTLPNTLGYARIAVILSSKQAPGSVNRNSWRRLTYNLSVPYLKSLSTDIVYTIKKGVLLDHRNAPMRNAFEKDIKFLLKKIHIPQEK